MGDGYDPADRLPPVLLGRDVDTGEEVCLPYADRRQGVAIVGKSGTGKSTLLEHLILADLEHGVPGMVIDPHGLLVERVMQVATPEQAERIILLEADVEAPFGLNLLAPPKNIKISADPVTWTADNVVATVKKLFGGEDSFQPRLEQYLDLAVRTLIPNNGTLVDVPRLFRNDNLRRQSLRQVIDPSVHEEWAAYDELRPQNREMQTEAITNRLSRMLRSRLMQGIVGSRETTVPFDEILDGDNMLLVSLPSDTLSPERCDFLGAMLLVAASDRLYTRDISRGLPPRIHIYVDEFARFATSTTKVLVDQGRKFGAGLTVAYQSLQQIRDWEIKSAAVQVGTLTVLGVTRPDAEELAGEFPVRPREERLEWVEEVNGTEPVTTPTLEPIAHLIQYGHSHPVLQEAAEHYRFGHRLGFSRGNQVENDLFVDAMYGRLTDDDLYRRAWKLVCSPVVFYRSREWDRVLLLGRFQYNGEPGEQSLSKELAQELERQTEVKEEYWWELADAFEDWYRTHFQHRAEFANPSMNQFGVAVSADDLPVFRDADERYIGVWRGQGCWGMPFLEYCDPDEPEKQQRRAHTPEEYEQSLRSSLQNYRSQLRSLFSVCEVIAEHPILQATGEYQPRVDKRLVVHPRQGEQDALNEFASQLTHPPEKYLAHVRLLSGYHPTRLRPPGDEEGGVGALVPDPVQPDDIRTRSRALYKVEQEPDAPESTATPEPRETRRVTRRPRPQGPTEE